MITLYPKSNENKVESTQSVHEQLQAKINSVWAEYKDDEILLLKKFFKPFLNAIDKSEYNKSLRLLCNVKEQIDCALKLIKALYSFRTELKIDRYEKAGDKQLCAEDYANLHGHASIMEYFKTCDENSKSSTTIIYNNFYCAYPHTADHALSSYPAGRKFANKLSEMEKTKLISLLRKQEEKQTLDIEESKFTNIAHVNYKIQEIRQSTYHERRNKTTLLRAHLKCLPFNVSLEWDHYLMKIIFVATGAYASKIGYGKCEEAAYESIAENIIQWLDLRQDSSIQLLALSKGNQNHLIVLYHASLITAEQISLLKSSHDLKQFICNLSPINSAISINLCDPWLNFHGNVIDWFTEMTKRQDHDMQLVEWDTLDVNNLSLPKQGSHTDQEYQLLSSLVLKLLNNQGALENSRSNAPSPF